MNTDPATKTTAKPLKHDWNRFDAMSKAQRHAAATRDPDAKPLVPDDFKRMKRKPRVKLIRRALGLRQEEFAGRFHISLGAGFGFYAEAGALLPAGDRRREAQRTVSFGLDNIAIGWLY